jgi:hypothetical protein
MWIGCVFIPEIVRRCGFRAPRLGCGLSDADWRESRGVQD